MGHSGEHAIFSSLLLDNMTSIEHFSDVLIWEEVEMHDSVAKNETLCPVVIRQGKYSIKL